MKKYIIIEIEGGILNDVHNLPEDYEYYLLDADAWELEDYEYDPWECPFCGKIFPKIEFREALEHVKKCIQ